MTLRVFGADWFGNGLRFERRIQGEMRSSSSRPREIPTSIDRNFIEPAGQVLLRIDLGKVSIQLDEDLLACVGCFVSISKEAMGKGDDSPLVLGHDLLEGTVISLPGAADQQLFILALIGHDRLFTFTHQICYVELV